MKKKSIRFKDCQKQFTIDQDKTKTPEETLEYFYDRVNSLDISILNEVRRIDNGRLDIPVYFSVCGDDAHLLTGTKKQMGKGASPAQAKASACMELAERFSLFHYKKNGDNFLSGDYRAIKGQGLPVLDLRYLLLSVHDNNADISLLEELLIDIPLQWVWGTNISSGKDVLIPFSWFFAINEFNGSSAGNSLEEAALQGICEIVERHVCSIISNDKITVPRVNPDSVNDTVAKELLHKFSANDIAVDLYDFSLNTGICTVAALVVDYNTFPDKSEIVFTAGTATNPEKAIIRTLTEVAQLGGDFNSGSNYVASGLPKPQSMAEVSYLTKTKDTKDIRRMYSIADTNLKVEIERAISALKNINMEILMVDVSHKNLQIPALYTIVPGAHFRERSRVNDIGLFAAKLSMELISAPHLLEKKLSQMEKLLPGSYYLEFYRGRNLINMGLMADALTRFNRALELQPALEDLPYIYSYKGICLKDLGRYDEALIAVNKGLAEDEERSDLHNTAGVCYFKKKDYEQAIRHFQRAVDLNPASAIDYANLGVNYAKIEKNDLAVEFLTLALTLDSDLDFARELLGTLVEK